jgi:hypothetical protein
MYSNHINYTRVTYSSSQTQYLPKNLQKYVLYSWLKNEQGSGKRLEDFFSNYKLLNYDVMVPQTLYKTTKIIATTADTTSSLFYRTQAQLSTTKKSSNEVNLLG